MAALCDALARWAALKQPEWQYWEMMDYQKKSLVSLLHDMLPAGAGHIAAMQDEHDELLDQTRTVKDTRSQRKKPLARHYSEHY